jgi:phosphoglycolate phosphatase-like HAD superfamily hydrolase
MARRGGAKAFAVTTGVTSREEWQRQTGLRRPDHVLTRLDDLLDCVNTPHMPAAVGSLR